MKPNRILRGNRKKQTIYKKTFKRKSDENRSRMKHCKRKQFYFNLNTFAISTRSKIYQYMLVLFSNNISMSSSGGMWTIVDVNVTFLTSQTRQALSKIKPLKPHPKMNAWQLKPSNPELHRACCLRSASYVLGSAFRRLCAQKKQCLLIHKPVLAV